MATNDPFQFKFSDLGRRAGKSTFMLSLSEAFCTNEIRIINNWVLPVTTPKHKKHTKKPKRRKCRNNPRPNRRRKEQKLRAAKQRPTWYQHITNEDEHVERRPDTP